MLAEGPSWALRRGPLGLLLLFLGSAGAELEVSVVSPVTAVVGSDALLECTYTVQSPSVDLKYLGILWRFNEQYLLTYGHGLNVFDPRASINESAIPNGKTSVLLSNVTISDEGSYTCSIIYTPQLKQKTVTLNIQARPKIIVPDQEVILGKENFLKCFVIGFYPMDIDVFWQRDGQVLPGSSLSKAQRNADGTFTINSTLPITPTASDTSANFSCRATHASLPRFIQKDAPLFFKVVEEKGVNAAAIVVPLLLIVALVAALGWFLYRRLTSSRLCKIQGPENWTVGEPVKLVCVGHHWPKDTRIVWEKHNRDITTEIPARDSPEQQALTQSLSEGGYRAETTEAQEGGNNLTLTTTLHITPSLEDEGAIFKCIFSPSDNNMKKGEEQFTDFKLFAKPQRMSSIACTPCDGGNVTCLLKLAQFYPGDIEMNWSCGTGSLKSIPSEDRRNRNDDHRTFDISSECVIPEEYFSDPNFKIRASWKHKSLKEPGYTEMLVTHKDFPGCPVLDAIVVPPLVSGVAASLQCRVSGYFPAKGLQVMWLKLKKGSTAPVPLTSGNDGCAASTSPEQTGHPYSCTAQLAFTPDLSSDQESEFICQVSHPSLPKALEKRTPKLSIMSVPRMGEPNIFQEGEHQVLTLNVTHFYPEKIEISWSCALPGKETRLPSKSKVKSSDGTFCIESRCTLTEVMICRIGQADINVSIEHESQTEPSRVAMRLDPSGNGMNWRVVKLGTEQDLMQL